jgi:CheY-like chemotaxis protein/two-component sensor histidine kinase
VIERQVLHLSRLVDDLLDVSRISRGTVELRKEVVDLTAAVQQAVETARPLLEERRHTLTVSMAPPPLRVNADATRLAQVIGNLLTNAAKYTDPGGQVWLTVEPQDGEAVVRVEDTGRGIPAEMLGKVFDLFTQVDASLDRAAGGLGIGLTLVRSLVEMHGGTVEALSDGSGRGCEFVVRLPVLVDGPESAAEGPGEEAEGEAGPSRRVLVVDDNRDAADSLALLLKMLGHEVRTAYEGPAALEAARAWRPEVLLLDLGLPGLDGYEVARRLRAELPPEELLIVALTGYGHEEDRRRSREAGCDLHLVKPAGPNVLHDLLAFPQPLDRGVAPGARFARK